MSAVRLVSSSLRWYANVVSGETVEYSGKPFNSPVNATPVIASVPPVTVISSVGIPGKVNRPALSVTAFPVPGEDTVAPDKGPSDALPLNPTPPAAPPYMALIA